MALGHLELNVTLSCVRCSWELKMIGNNIICVSNCKAIDISGSLKYKLLVSITENSDISFKFLMWNGEFVQLIRRFVSNINVKYGVKILQKLIL